MTTYVHVGIYSIVEDFYPLRLWNLSGGGGYWIASWKLQDKIFINYSYLPNLICRFAPMWHYTDILITNKLYVTNNHCTTAKFIAFPFEHYFKGLGILCKWQTLAIQVTMHFLGNYHFSGLVDYHLAALSCAIELFSNHLITSPLLHPYIMFLVLIK